MKMLLHLNLGHNFSFLGQKQAYRRYDVILNTLSGPHEVRTFLPMLDHYGTIVQLRLMINPHNVSA